MKVFVLNKDGKPLMPTTPRKARLLRESGQAKVVGYDPYTLQLLYGSSGYVQPVTVGLTPDTRRSAFRLLLTERNC